MRKSWNDEIRCLLADNWVKSALLGVWAKIAEDAHGLMNRAEIAICASSNFKKVKRRENFLLDGEEENTFQKSLSRVAKRARKPKTRKNASTRSTRDGFQHGWSGFHMQEISENPFPSVSSVTNYRLICDEMARHANFHFSPGLVDDFFFDVFRPSPLQAPQILLEFSANNRKKHSIHATSLVAVASERDRLANNVFRNIWLAGWQPRKIITRKERLHDNINLRVSLKRDRRFSILEHSARLGPQKDN